MIPQSTILYNNTTPIKLQDIINPDDQLIRLAFLIDWELLSRQYHSKFKQGISPSPRLLFGLFYLQAKEEIDSEELMKLWETSPEWQFFCGEETLNDTFPLHPSQLSIWRREIGPGGYELMCVALPTSH